MDNQLKKLRSLIKRYAQSYYEGSQEISDAEFDSLVDQLHKISPDDPILSTPGWGYVVDSKKKAKHIGSTIGSLDKIKYPNSVDTKGKIITCKLDGGSIVLYFNNGVLMEALTRGNGSIGMSCLHKMQYLLPNVKITDPDLVSIRGEVFIPNPYHQTLIDRGIPNPRNYANGIINRIEAGEDIEMLRFVPYSIRIYNRILTKRQMFDKLSEWGFKRIPFISGEEIKDVDDLKNLYEKWSISLPIDGLVLTDDQTISTAKIETNVFSIEETSIAYKFESAKAQVEVGSVEWQTGDIGRIIPVIKLTKPIFLTGANIVSITAHNASQVKNKGIGEGAKITIERAGEVIPYLVSVDKKGTVDLPDFCPDCGKQLEWKGLDLYCYNQYCFTKQFSAIKEMLGICGIPDGFGDKFLKKWVGNNNFEDIIDYCNQKKANSDLPSNHYGKLSQKLEANLFKKFNEGFSYQEFWKMIRIPGLGSSASKKLKSIDPKSLTQEKILELSNLPSNVIEEMTRTFFFWKKIANKVPFIVSTTKATKYIVVVTGPVSVTRKEFKEFLADNGVELRESMSKEVNYLVTNDPTTGSGKLQKAAKLGIPIITENGLTDLLGIE